MREIIQKGYREGFIRTDNHPFVGQTAINESGHVYKVVSFLIGIQEFETENSKDIISYEYQYIEEDIIRYQKLNKK